jgi:hypothetical protein
MNFLFTSSLLFIAKAETTLLTFWRCFLLSNSRRNLYNPYSEKEILQEKAT